MKCGFWSDDSQPLCWYIYLITQDVFLTSRYLICLWFVLLLQAGKLAPYWYKVYLELGNYYVTHDLVKARCCYKKALYLNKRSSEVAMALSDIYRIQGETVSILN